MYNSRNNKTGCLLSDCILCCLVAVYFIWTAVAYTIQCSRFSCWLVLWHWSYGICIQQVDLLTRIVYTRWIIQLLHKSLGDLVHSHPTICIALSPGNLARPATIPPTTQREMLLQEKGVVLIPVYVRYAFTSTRLIAGRQGEIVKLEGREPIIQTPSHLSRHSKQSLWDSKILAEGV